LKKNNEFIDLLEESVNQLSEILNNNDNNILLSNDKDHFKEIEIINNDKNKFSNINRPEEDKVIDQKLAISNEKEKEKEENNQKK